MNNHRLCIGLQLRTAEWEMLLHTLGVWFEEVDYGQPLKHRYSVIILNDMPKQKQVHALKEYLMGGGALLEIGEQLTFNPKKNIQYRYRRTLPAASSHPDYAQLGHIDVYCKVGLHQDSDLLGGFVHAQKINDGILAYLGTDMAQVLQEKSYMRKRFFFSGKNYPDELVSKPDKKQLLSLFKKLLKQLHINRDMPFVTKWHSPSLKPVFAFRIDSDFGNRESVDALHQTLQKYDIRATWFLHVKAHEKWLKHFHTFKHQEFALHGYNHGTSGSVQKVRENIFRGLQILENHGFDIDGFCAPYGIYNKALERVLGEFDFRYSSEFTFAYDSLPLQPLASSPGDTLPLQIPVHPICTGSMSRKHFTPQQMTGYFTEVLEHSQKGHTPVIFYHHPMQPGLESLEPVFEQVQQGHFEHLTFGEFAGFWKERQQCTFEANWNGQKLNLSSANRKLLFQVFTEADRFSLRNAGSEIDTDKKTADFVLSKNYLPTESDIQDMKSHSLKLFKTSLLDWKNRIRL